MSDRLGSWKEIAAYLKRDIRTVQRWEQTRGLPVQRVPGGKRDVITASKPDIDNWLSRSAGQLETEEASAPALPTPASRRTRHLFWIAAALVPSVAAIWLLVPREAAPEPVWKPVPLTSYPGRELEPCFSPEGGEVAFSWNGEEEQNFDIYIKVVGTEKALRLTFDPRVDINPAWSPGGRSIAFLRELAGGRAEVLLVGALGGPEHKVGEVDTLGRSRCPLLAWAPDGKNLVVVHRLSTAEPYGLFSMSRSSGAMRRITSPPQGGRGDSGVALSPDGRSLAFSRMPGGPGRGELHVLSVTEDLQPAGAPRPLTSWSRITVGPAWTSAGRQLVVSSTDSAGTLWRFPVAAPHRARQLQSLGEDAYQPAASQPAHGPSALVFVRQFSDSNIWSVSIPGRSATPLIASTRNEHNPQFAPDGSRIAFLSDRSGLPEMYLSRPDGSDAVQLGSMGEWRPGPLRWSPDGTRIVFSCTNPGGVCVVDVPGGTPRRVTGGGSYDSVPSWSRDGKWIYFGSNRSGEHQVWKTPAGGGAAVQVTKSGGWASEESPDGRMLYYVKDSGIHPALWSVPVTGGDERQVLESVRARAFAVTKGGIYFIPRLDPASGGTLRYFDFSSGRNAAIAPVGKSTGLGLSLSPDGRTILYTQVKEGSDLMIVEGFR